MTDALHIYAYDVTDDRRRARVSKILETEGVRVQHSLFEIIQRDRDAAHLTDRIERELEAGDRLRVYRMPLTQVRSIRCYGGAPVQEGADYWLL